MSRQYGWSPIHIATYNGYIEVVSALISSGADVQAKTKVSRAEREGSGVGY
jgi:ankyrin repeat protein